MSPLTTFKIDPAKLIAAVFLIIGTSVGAGMLGLPVETGQYGLAPTLTLHCICWIIMTISGLLILEVITWMKKECNLISMASSTIGKKVVPFIWCVYILLFYSLLTVYAKGSLQMFSLTYLNNLPEYIKIVIFLLLFVPCIWIGGKALNRFNFPVVVGLFLSFFLLIFLGFPSIDTTLFQNKKWEMSFIRSLPVILTAYGFHIIIPTIYRHLDKNIRLCRLAIILGSTFTFVLYMIWQTFVMGVVPYEGAHSLSQALIEDQTAIAPLSYMLGSTWVGTLGKLFGTCSLITSFLGVSVALFDFLADGLKLHKEIIRHKISLCILIFLPPLAFSLLDLPVFYIFLKYGGGIGVTILLVILPAVMIYCLQQKNIKPYSFSINKTFISISVFLLLTFSLLVLYSELSSWMTNSL